MINLPRNLVALALIVCWQTGSAFAHEYWLEPLEYTIEKGQALQGNLRNGQDFKGSDYSFIKSGFEQFTINKPTGASPVTGRSGDRPALNQNADEPGLISVSYQGNFDRLVFNDAEKIVHYIEYEGLDGVLERHLERGFSEARFQEQYARCAKALYQVGAPNADDKDGLTGLKFELVAEANPYTLSPSDALPVRLYWEGKPMSNKQIRMFRFNGELKTQIFRTDDEGRAEIPLEGGGKFMLNAVHIFEGDDDPDTKLAEWVSYWASLTFGLADSDELLAKVTQDKASE